MSSPLRRVAACLAAFAAVIAMAGCTSSSQHQAQPTVNPHPIETLRNDLPGGQLVKVHKFPSEPFTITTTYSTTYDTAAWRITDNKTLHYKVSISGTTAQTVVLLQHVHADVSLSGKNRTEFNGLEQDSMDEHLSNGDQPGPQITSDYPSENDFSITGYSQFLVSGWGYAAGGYGSSELSDTRLNEDTLRSNGVSGNKLVFVYIFLVKDKGDALYHQLEFTDEFLVQAAR